MSPLDFLGLHDACGGVQKVAYSLSIRCGEVQMSKLPTVQSIVELSTVTPLWFHSCCQILKRVDEMYSLGTCPAKNSRRRAGHRGTAGGGASPTNQSGDAIAKGITRSNGLGRRSCVCSLRMLGGGCIANAHGGEHSLFVWTRTTGSARPVAPAMIGTSSSRFHMSFLAAGCDDSSPPLVWT